MLRVASHQPAAVSWPQPGPARGHHPVASARLARSARLAHRSWSRIPRALLLVMLGLTIAVSASASARKARNLYEQGRKAEVAKDYDRALELYEQAMNEDPKHQRYELASRRMRFMAAQAHVDRGQQLRDQDLLEEALAEFQRAMEIDPSLDVARQEHARTLEKLEKRREAGESSVEEETTSALEQDRTQRERKIAALKAPPALQPMSTQPINVTIPNQDSRVIFETIGKLAGINVLMDPEYQDKKMSVELQNATLYEALDYVSLLSKAFWKPISHNAIFITNDNTNKRRDYEEEVVKTFYLTNVATPQEMQEIMTAIRGLTDLRRMFPVNSMNALVIRGPEAKLALAEKVINDVDKPRAEVLIDVLVIETSKSKTREMGITPMSGATSGIDIPLVFSPTGATTSTSGEGGDGGSSGGGGVPLSRLGSLSTRDWVTTLPGGRIAALMNSTDSRLLQSPRVRTADGSAASIRIGDRIPIATGSFQPGVGGVGINPLVNTQFNFEDVGVNVDLTPKIHNDREVSLHIEVEISNVRDRVDIGGIEQPIIGQRRITHDIRIVEGEASVMGGLNQTQTFKTKSGVPFLGEVPILGNLFSTTKTETSENEILIVLVPHIVRLPQIDDVNLQEVASGTDAIFQVRSQPQRNGRAALPPVGANAPAAGQPSLADARPAGETPAAETSPAATAPATAEPATAPPATAEPEPPAAAEPQPAPSTPQQAAPGQPGGEPRLVFEPAAIEIAPGATATVNVVVENATQLFGSPLRIGFDPRVIRVTDITKGTFLEGDGMDLIFAKNIRGEVGQAAVNISRFPGTGGSDGRGVLVTLHLEGVAAGSSKIGVTSTGARNADAQPIRIPAAQLPVTVR